MLFSNLKCRCDVIFEARCKENNTTQPKLTISPAAFLLLPSGERQMLKRSYILYKDAVMDFGKLVLK